MAKRPAPTDSGTPPAPTGHGAPPADSHHDPRRSQMGAIVLHHSVTALMLTLCLGLGVWSYLTFRKTSFFESAATHESSQIRAVTESAQLSRLHVALRVFHHLDGRYPLALDELVQRNILLPSDLAYPDSPHVGATHYVYKRTLDAYTLEVATRAHPPATQPPL